MKKTKILAVILTAMMAVGSLSAFVGCTGRDQGERVDPNKTQLRIGYFDGGYGREWMKEAERIYEAENPDVQVMVTYEKKRYESSALLASYGTYNEDIFFVDTAVYSDFKASNFYYDITEAVSTPLTEYGESRSILDKMNASYKEYYNESETADGIKYYAVPFFDGIYSIYYDIDLFEKEALYKDADGNWTNGIDTPKSLGKDGVEGTYDDGLPTTVDEFFALCDYMTYTRNITPFTWPGTEGYYTTKVLENFWASYEGEDNYMLNYTLDSKGEPYTFLDGTSEPITVQNGYKLKAGQAGKKEALQFGYDILNGHNGNGTGGAYHSNKVFGTSQDNRAAQNEFIFSINQGRRVAFLIDGSWWEREAIEDFNTLVKRTDESNAYGTRRFGILPLPTVHQTSDDKTAGTQDVFSAVGENSQVWINKNTKIADVAVDFFRFLHTDKILSLMTSYSNTLRPYSYTVSDADKQRMTPLGKQFAELSDSMVRIPPLLLNEEVRNSEANIYYGWQGWQFGPTSDSTISAYPMVSFYNNSKLTVDQLLNALKIEQSAWEAALQ